MKRLTISLCVLVVLLSYAKVAPAQLNVRGYLSSSVYGWENPAENRQWDFYQGLRLRLRPQTSPNIYLNTFLRAAYRGDPAEWQEKIYNLYLNWNITGKHRLRLGRQFLYHGVLNGTVDGALLSSELNRNLRVKLFAGSAAPIDRTLKFPKWDEGNMLGGYLTLAFAEKAGINLSYIQKNRSNKKYWQQAGADFHAFFNNRLTLYARFDYNLLRSSYQVLRLRLNYLKKNWSLAGEFNSQKPRIYEDSFFNIFEIRAYRQFRMATSYRVKRLELSLQYLHTIYDQDSDDRIIAAVNNRYGSIGVIYQTGFGGKNLGYFGEFLYPILPQLSLRLYNSYYRYERAVTDISEDALAFSAGLRYRVMNRFIIQTELQQSQNSYFKNDWRGLLRVSYLINP